MARSVLVVSGIPRSGTSLAMALLEAGGIPLLEDTTRPADDDNPLGYHELALVKRLPHDTAWLARAEGRAIKVVHPLLPRLPDGPSYRVILMRRDLREVVESQDRMLARRGAPPGTLPPSRLMSILAAQRGVALAWLRARPERTWMELDYNGLLRDPAPGLAALSAFAGLRAAAGALESVVRPNLYRNRLAQ